MKMLTSRLSFMPQAGSRNSVDDLYSVGKTVFICIVLLVNAEVRYFTGEPFCFDTLGSKNRDATKLICTMLLVNVEYGGIFSRRRHACGSVQHPGLRSSLSPAATRQLRPQHQAAALWRQWRQTHGLTPRSADPEAVLALCNPLQVLLVARYWTKIFVIFVILSYVVAYIFLLVRLQS